MMLFHFCTFMVPVIRLGWWMCDQKIYYFESLVSAEKEFQNLLLKTKNSDYIYNRYIKIKTEHFFSKVGKSINSVSCQQSLLTPRMLLIQLIRLIIWVKEECRKCRLSTKTPDYQLGWAVVALCRQLDILKPNFHFVWWKFSQPQLLGYLVEKACQQPLDLSYWVRGFYKKIGPECPLGHKVLLHISLRQGWVTHSVNCY